MWSLLLCSFHSILPSLIPRRILGSDSWKTPRCLHAFRELRGRNLAGSGSPAPPSLTPKRSESARAPSRAERELSWLPAARAHPGLQRVSANGGRSQPPRAGLQIFPHIGPRLTLGAFRQPRFVGRERDQRQSVLASGKGPMDLTWSSCRLPRSD